MSEIERRAWSENLGHENQRITRKHYGKLSPERRFEVLESIGDNDPLAVRTLSDDEKIALVDAVLANFNAG